MLEYTPSWGGSMANKKLYSYNGELLSINVIAGRVLLSKSTIYKYLKQGYTICEAVELGKRSSNTVFKNRSKTNNRIAKKYSYYGEELTVGEICEREGISKEPLYRKIKKGISAERAVEIIKQNKAPKYPYGGGMYSKYTLEKITGVSLWYLNKHIADDDTYTEEEILSIINGYCSQTVMMYGGMSLYQYCIKNGYNYNVIYYSIKEYGITIEESIKQYLMCGQVSRFSHKYALGDILLYHFMMKMHIDDRYVMDRIRKGRTEEEALVDAIFFNRENYKNQNVRKRLRAIYDEIGDITDLVALQTALGLDDDDIEFLNQKSLSASKVLTQYHLFFVHALIQGASNIDEVNEILQKEHLTYEQFNELYDELLDGFVPRDENLAQDGIKYIWRKEN